MDDPRFLIPLAILFLASLIRATLGFGDALFAMPLLALFLPLTETAPIVTLLSTTNGLVIFIASFRSIDFRNAGRLLSGAVVGVPCGLLLLKYGDDAWIKLGLAFMIIAFSLFSLCRPHLLELKTDRLAVLFGFLAGFVGGAVNAHGPPLVVYGALRRWDADRFRATLQGYFLPAGILTMAGHAVAGLWTENVGRTYLSSIPMIVLAFFVGGRLRRMIPQLLFVRSLHVLLILLGLFLIHQAWNDAFSLR